MSCCGDIRIRLGLWQTLHTFLELGVSHVRVAVLSPVLGRVHHRLIVIQSPPTAQLVRFSVPTGVV